MEQIINKPLVSIVTVCFNSAKTIRRTIESVLNQTYVNIEYIIVDGKSTDGTVTIIEEYAPLFAERGIQYRWVSEPDDGIYDAMNKGIIMATGEWIGIINSDDWYELDACDNVINHSQYNCDLIFGIVAYWRDGCVSFAKQISLDSMQDEPVIHPGVFVRRLVYQKIGVYDTEFKIAADYDFLARCYRLNVNSSILLKLVANFTHGGISSTNLFLSKKESLIIQEKYRLISKFRLFKRKVKFLISTR